MGWEDAEGKRDEEKAARTSDKFQRPSGSRTPTASLKIGATPDLAPAGGGPTNGAVPLPVRGRGKSLALPLALLVPLPVPPPVGLTRNGAGWGEPTPSLALVNDDDDASRLCALWYGVSGLSAADPLPRDCIAGKKSTLGESAPTVCADGSSSRKCDEKNASIGDSATVVADGARTTMRRGAAAGDEVGLARVKSRRCTVGATTVGSPETSLPACPLVSDDDDDDADDDASRFGRPTTVASPAASSSAVPGAGDARLSLSDGPEAADRGDSAGGSRSLPMPRATRSCPVWVEPGVGGSKMTFGKGPGVRTGVAELSPVSGVSKGVNEDDARPADGDDGDSASRDRSPSPTPAPPLPPCCPCPGDGDCVTSRADVDRGCCDRGGAQCKSEI